MDSEKLSKRTKQPGHDRTFTASEKNFADVLYEILPKKTWEVREKPDDLAKLFDGKYGIIPEVALTYLPTDRTVYFEVKKQGNAGNAEERACKHHTVRFYEVMHEVTGYDYHPFVTVMCESLATNPRYTGKHPYFFEDDQYFCWVDYDRESLKDFIEHLRKEWLAP